MGNEDRAAAVRKIAEAAITDIDKPLDADAVAREIAVKRIGDAAITNADQPLDFDVAVAEIAAARAARDAANDNEAENQRDAA